MGRERGRIIWQDSMGGYCGRIVWEDIVGGECGISGDKRQTYLKLTGSRKFSRLNNSRRLLLSGVPVNNILCTSID
jgi:hypothetical protein